MNHKVAVFGHYPFEVGEKIRIVDGRRKGDWLVVAIAEHTITLQCPLSKKEFEWAKFCYLVDKDKNLPWPGKEEF
jgi:hypothetical protein